MDGGCRMCKGINKTGRAILRADFITRESGVLLWKHWMRIGRRGGGMGGRCVINQVKL
jgi:hypothetical protein